MRSHSRRFLALTGLVVFLLIATRLFAGRSLLVPVDTARRLGTSGYVAAAMHSQQQQQQQDNSRAAPAYAPGTYMAGRRPENSTFCRFQHGLPMILAYPAAKLTGSPEAGEHGPYRVLPFVLRGASQNIRDVDLPRLTLCTHATADQVYNVVELARRWEGPVSLAVFSPGLDAGLAVALLERACRCEPEMSKV